MTSQQSKTVCMRMTIDATLVAMCHILTEIDYLFHFLLLKFPYRQDEDWPIELRKIKGKQLSSDAINSDDRQNEDVINKQKKYKQKGFGNDGTSIECLNKKNDLKL